ncbi:Thyroid hormone receptor-associated protein 3 BCLAF1 and THRAP3 family member 2 [Larimichthys crocea]|uniref:Thyroid hormone receptor-associated protein 3 BCLAF1 and THRAP3 family member 2 n=1 Tax=Larimichthys crocea TaxID=215358 RepID=A0A6G0IC23_LARCR|nr:Thyroid hormone receptor-associated protein 3 BCLAF1 and THRAP3 family member 2 [Larimichthys crocea]
MKKRNSSRSRSRSRSHSPPHNREKKYPRGYQNSREFRGYHRGFRRPYNFRGRGRGYFPRGRYQRGGGGGGYNNNNNNFRPNWKNYKQHPQKHQQQQQQYQQQQNYSRGRCHNLQKRSGSPPRGHSHHSDRSSTPLSRHSQHSSSSSHSSSPKCRQALLPTNQNSKDVKEELLASKEVQKGGGEDGEPVELVGVLAEEAKEGSGSGKTEGNWQSLTDCSRSPKRTSPLASSAVIVGQNSQTTNQSSPSPKITNDTSNGAPFWKKVCSSSSTKKPSHEGLNPMLSSFDFFSNEEYLDGDKTAISIAFGKFLEEQNKKAKSWENGKKTAANDVDMEQEKVNGKSSATISDSVSRKYKEDIDEVSLNSFLKTSPFLSADGEEEEEMIIKPHSKSLHKDCHNGDESSKPKTKVTYSARELFEECFEKWQNAAYSQVANSDLDTTAEDIYLSRKQDKAAAIAAALAKRELAGKFEELSPEMGGKAKKMAKSPSIPSTPPPPPPLPRRNSDREMFMIMNEDSPFMSSRKQEAKLNVRMDFLGDSLISSSDILAEERQLSQDLVQSSKKDQEFRSIFQHVQNAQLKRCPSELFAQHIVTIVHHIKAQHFPSSGMTLNERFTMYQRRAAEKEMMKPRKSPEIHRRIDVSPRAFKKHSQLFEAMKSSEDGSYKDGGEKMKGDPMDLRLDIERRKKYSTHPSDYNQDRGRDTGDSPDSSRERSVEKFSKCHEKSKKNKKKRSRSSSSSSSSSSKSQKEDLPHGKSDPKDKVFDKARLGQKESSGSVERGRPRGGFQVRIRGRGWNRGNYQGNCSQSTNMPNMAAHPKNEDWDPEYTPKSRKYYLHDDRDGETELKWVDHRGRGRGNFSRGRARFIIRKATGGPNATSQNWAHDKFQVNGEQGGKQEGLTEQDHKGGKNDGEHT